MKRFQKTMGMVAAMLALCLVCVLSITAEAAEYKNGATYVNPHKSYYKSKSEYYSVNKIRMSTYSDETFYVVYPKDATLQVKSTKKAMQATIIEQSNADISGQKWSDVVYVPATVTEYEYYYRNYAKGDKISLTRDDATGQYYYIDGEIETRYYDAELEIWRSKWEDKKVYVTPNYTVPVKATYTDPATGVVYTYEPNSWRSNLYYNEDKGFYIYKSVEGVQYQNNQYQSYEKSTDKYEYATAKIKLSSTKAGTYKVNVIVNGKKYVMTVFVSTYTGAYNKVTVNGKTAYSYSAKKTSKDDSYTSTYNYNVKKGLKSAKFKVSVNKGFKVKGIVTAYLNADGKAVYKKGKNGSTIPLSQEYDVNNRYGVYGNTQRSTVKNTYVYVSWQDTKLKTSCIYSVVSKNGVKKIKRVQKKTDGKTYTDYLEYGVDCDECLWSY